MYKTKENQDFNYLWLNGTNLGHREDDPSHGATNSRTLKEELWYMQFIKLVLQVS